METQNCGLIILFIRDLIRPYVADKVNRQNSYLSTSHENKTAGNWRFLVELK